MFNLKKSVFALFVVVLVGFTAVPAKGNMSSIPSQSPASDGTSPDSPRLVIFETFMRSG